MLIDSGGTARISTTTVPVIDPNVDTGFADSARGTEPQWTLDTDLADLSADVYNNPSDEGIGEGNWTRVSDEVMDDAGIRPNELIDPETGFQAAIYTDGNGQVVVAFAGTDPASIDDWINNAQQGVGLNSEQYDQAIALGQKAVDAFGQGNVVFTGHSLGGGLASATSLATGSPAVTFNAAGIGPETLAQLGITQDAASRIASDGQIRRYNVENDILTNAQQKSFHVPGTLFTVNLPDALGYEITLENPNGAEDPVRAHLNGAVGDAMRSRDIKTEQNDNIFERLLERNLFPMGPSTMDIVQTGADGAEWTWNNVVQPAGEWTVDNVLIPAAVETTEALIDTYQTGREVVDNVVDVGGDVVETLDPRNWSFP